MASCVIKCDHNVRNGKQEVNIMWTSQSMTLLESLTISAMGLTVVLGVLSMLAIAIVLFSKLLNLGGKKAAPAAPQPAGPQGPTEEEQCAVILSVICEELRADPKDIQIKSIRRL